MPNAMPLALAVQLTVVAACASGASSALKHAAAMKCGTLIGCAPCSHEFRGIEPCPYRAADHQAAAAPTGSCNVLRATQPPRTCHDHSRSRTPGRPEPPGTACP